MAGGEALVLALAMKAGHDPYRLYNSLDAEYRRTTAPHPCPMCYSLPLKRGVSECSMCRNRGVVFLPTDELSEPRLPPYPHRVKAFSYGCIWALNELEGGRR
jgi:hypothetical protein